MRHKIRCPIHLYQDGQELNAYQLIAASYAKQPELKLEIRNDAGESRIFVFRPNRELTKIPHKVMSSSESGFYAFFNANFSCIFICLVSLAAKTI